MPRAEQQVRRRRWPRRLAVVATLVLCAMATIPWWFPQAARHTASLLGIRSADASRLGLHRFRLQQVRGEFGPAIVSCRELILPLPHAWILSILRNEGERPALVGRDWSVFVTPNGDSPPATADASPAPPAIQAGVREVASRLAWIGGPVLLENGQVQWADGSLEIPTVTCDRRQLLLAVRHGARTLLATVAPHAPDATAFSLQLSPEPFRIQGTLAASPTGWHLAGTMDAWNRQGTLTAEFPANHWIPRTASLESSRAPVDLTRLPPPWPASVEAAFDVRWRDGQGRFTATATAETRPANTLPATPFQGFLTGRFDLASISLEHFRLDAAPLQVRLHERITLPWSETDRVPAVVLDARGETSAFLPGWVEGEIEMRLRPTDSTSHPPSVLLELTGPSLELRGVGRTDLNARAVINWPSIHVETLRAARAGGGVLTVEGTADAESRIVREAMWSYRGPIDTPASGRPRLPVVSASGSFQGNVARLEHAGSARTEGAVSLPHLRPAEVSVAWSGSGADTFTMEARLVGEPGEAAFSAAIRRGTTTPTTTAPVTVEVRTLRIGRGETTALAATRPFLIHWGEHPNGGITLPELSLAGDAGTLSASVSTRWPEDGAFRLSARSVHLQVLAPWLEHPPSWMQGITVPLANLQAQLVQGALQGEGALAIEAAVPDVGNFRLDTQFRGDPQGLHLPALSLARNDAPPIVATVSLPVQVRAVREGLDWATTDAPLRGKLAVFPEAWPWVLAQDLLRLRSTNVTLRADLSGTLRDPTATVELDAGRTAYLPRDSQTPAPWTVADHVRFRSRLSSREIVLDPLQVGIAGQQILLTGRVPRSTSDPTSNSLESALDWERAEGRLLIENAALAPFTEPWRSLLPPTGELKADVRWAGGRIGGWLEISNAAARPAAWLGSLRDVNVRLRLDGTRAEVERGTVSLNGQPIQILGGMDLPWMGSGNIAVQLQGTNVALARSGELLLRADLHLGLNRSNDASRARLSGDVRLRESLVLVDFRDAVSVDLERAERRPPFFSISAPPFSDWDLDVHVHGTRFGRVVSSAIQGTLSADTRLLGTLRNPRLLGDIAAEEGAVIFPFGRLALNAVRVRFTETDPFRPALEGRAEGMNFGYTVALDLGGTLADPEVKFTSLPPLSTGEIVQMLTAGTLPRGEFAFSDSGKVQRVGTYLARDILSTISGNPGTESRLSIRSGQNVSTAGRLTYGVEYKLSDRWSLVGEYDRWNQLNGGVRFRVLER